MAILLPFLLGAAGRVAASEGAPPAGNTLDVGGSKIYYEQCGSGPAVVLLHDGLVHSVTWDGSWSALCRKFHVIRYDRRGYGRSQAAAARFSQAEDLHALLTHVGVQRAIVAGNSSGGALAIDFALAYPGMVRGLLLVGSIVHGMGVTDHFRERGHRNMAPLEKGDVAGAADNWSRDAYIIAPGHEAARKKLRDALAGNPQNLKSGDVEIRSSPPAVARLSEISAPTLILVGEADIPDVHAHCGIIEAGIPGAHREVVKGAGHLIQLDNPDFFTEKLGWFIERNERKEVIVPVSTLEEYAGRYDFGGGYNLTITRTDGRLIGQATGDLAFHLFAESSSRFFLKSEDAEVEFTRDAAGKVNQAIIHEKGTATKAPRL